MPQKRQRDGSGTAGGSSAGASSDAALGVALRRTVVALHATLFVTGAAIMLVEILGTRIIGPVFGVSLFVWAALLAVTMASLAVGYYLGGVLVDRAPARRTLSLAVLIGGASLGVTPLLSGPVLGFAEELGPRVGSLVSATALFGPCLAVLGMAGPMVVRLATNDLRATGHRVGGAYAVSTAGSLLGTLVTAFVLIPNFDTNHILVGTAVVLGVLGAVPLAFQRDRVALAGIVIPLLALASSQPKLPPGISVVERAQSPYGLVEVIDDLNRGVRLLRADHSIIGGHAIRDRSAVFAFLHLLESLRFLRPEGKDLLQVGLGIGSLPMALRPFGIRADVVEIDPEVARLAAVHFAFSTTGQVFVEDARTFLDRTDRRYDFVVHDTFTGGTTPEHLLSEKVFIRIRAVLRPGGVLALNFAGYDRGPRADASRAVARTLRAVFPHVRAFRDSPPHDDADAPANLVFFASDSPIRFDVPKDARFENAICRDVLLSFHAWEVLREIPPETAIITDRRNPLARLQLPIAEEHFWAMRKLLAREVWLRF